MCCEFAGDVVDHFEWRHLVQKSWLKSLRTTGTFKKMHQTLYSALFLLISWHVQYLKFLPAQWWPNTGPSYETGIQRVHKLRSSDVNWRQWSWLIFIRVKAHCRRMPRDCGNNFFRHLLLASCGFRDLGQQWSRQYFAKIKQVPHIKTTSNTALTWQDPARLSNALTGLMMTSSNGNIFRATGPLCGEFTGPGEFPAQRPVTLSFDVFFHLRLNKRLSKQPRGWWFETPPWSLWRQCNVINWGRDVPIKIG